VVVRERAVGKYCRLITNQVLGQIGDIGIDSNNQLNVFLDQLAEIPLIFSQEALSISPHARRLHLLPFLFKCGLRELYDAVLADKLPDFRYEELERVVEARFEDTGLRESLLRTMSKACKS
jgi:hypothetical protein